MHTFKSLSNFRKISFFSNVELISVISGEKERILIVKCMQQAAEVPIGDVINKRIAFMLYMWTQTIKQWMSIQKIIRQTRL